MTGLFLLLALCLVAAVALAAYQFAQSSRWRETAMQTKSESDRLRIEAEDFRSELESTRAIAKEHETNTQRAREVAAVEVRLLNETKSQLEERFRSLAYEALQN